MKKFFHRYRLWLTATVFLLLSASVWFVFAPFGNVSDEPALGNFTPEELFREFTSDPAGASMRLSGKVILLQGKVAATDDGYVILGEDMVVVKCVLRRMIYDRSPLPIVGDSVILKCVCRGLNLTEVLVTHCIIINKTSS